MQDVIFVIVLIVVAILSLRTNKLTTTGIILACVIAICIYSGTDFPGIAFLGAFFLLGVISTSWQRKAKEHFLSHEDEQTRNGKQVLANGTVAALLGLIAYFFPEHKILLTLMIACSLSSATADTISSELGILYGKKFYTITDLKPGLRGDNGVVSIEGTLLGLAASVLIALIFILTVECTLLSFITIIVAGLAGNLADSILGATLEKNHIIGNNAVNFLNTLIGALAGGLIAY